MQVNRPCSTGVVWETLPAEVLEHIFHYVPAKYLRSSLRAVCRRFHAVIENPQYWLRRIDYRRNTKLLDRDRKGKRLFRLARIARASEEACLRFDENDCLTDFFSEAKHTSTPDALHCRTINGRRMLFTGSRDHSVVLWDLSKVVEQRSMKSGFRAQVASAHNGWVWALTTFENESFYSGGWDREIKEWKYASMSAGSSPVMTHHYTCTSAVMSLISMDSCLVGGTFNGDVSFVDFRSYAPLAHRVQLRPSAIFSIVMDEESNGYRYIVGNAAGSVYVFDKRNVERPVIKAKFESLRSLVYGSGQVAVNQNNQTTILNASTLDIDLDFTGVTQSAPFLCAPTDAGYFCANDFDISYYTPGASPNLVAEATYSNRITNMMYFNGDLVASVGEGSIQFWPREQAALGRFERPETTT